MCCRKFPMMRSSLVGLLVVLAGCLVQPNGNNNTDSNNADPLEQLVQRAIAQYAHGLAELSDDVAEDLSKNKHIDERQLHELLTERARLARSKAWKQVDAHWAAQLSQWEPKTAARLLKQQANGYRSAERALRNTNPSK